MPPQVTSLPSPTIPKPAAPVAAAKPQAPAPVAPAAPVVPATPPAPAAPEARGSSRKIAGLEDSQIDQMLAAEREGKKADLPTPQDPLQDPPQDPPVNPQDPPKNDDVPESIKSTKAADDFRKLKGERDEAQRKQKEIAAELESLKTLAKTGDLTKAQLETLKAEQKALVEERDVLSERLKMLDIERHPHFQNHFDSRINATIAQVKRVVGAKEGEQLTKLLNEPESPLRTAQLRELVSSLDDYERVQVGPLITQIDAIRNDRQTEIKNWQQNWTRIQQEERQQYQQRVTEMEQTFEGQLQAVLAPESGMFMFQPKQGDESWNAQVAQRLHTARSLFGGNVPPAEIAKASLWAAAAPVLVENLIARDTEIAQLREEIQALRGVSPNPAGGAGAGAGSGSGSEGGDGRGGSWIDRAVEDAVKNGLVR